MKKLLTKTVFLLLLSAFTVEAFCYDLTTHPASVLNERLFDKNNFVSPHKFMKMFMQYTDVTGNEKITVHFPAEMREDGTNDFTVNLPDGISWTYKEILTEYIAARILNTMLNNGGTRCFVVCPEKWIDTIERSLTRYKLYGRIKDRLETYYGVSSFKIQYNPAEVLTDKRPQFIQKQKNPSISYHDSDGVYIGIDIGGSSIKLAAIVRGKEHILGKINEKFYAGKSAQEYIGLVKKSIMTAHKQLCKTVNDIKIDGIGISWNAAIKDNIIIYEESEKKRLGATEIEKILHLPDDIRNWVNKTYGPEVGTVVRNDGHMGAFQAAYSERRSKTAYLGVGTSIAFGCINREGRNAPGLCELHFSRIDLNSTGNGSEYDIPGSLGYYLTIWGIIKEGKKLGVVKDDIPAISFEEAARIVSQANAGDKIKLSIAKTMGRYLAEVALNICDNWSVDHVIVGGGLLTGKFGNTMIEEAKHILKKNFPEVKISLSQYNGNVTYVSAIGAARYVSSMKSEREANANKSLKDIVHQTVLNQQSKVLDHECLICLHR